MMDPIQITYDEIVTPLSAEIETLICEKITRVLERLKIENRYLSLYFCSINTIRDLNREYRHKDVPTDVLSWSYGDQAMEEIPGPSPWGELAVCLDVTKNQAQESGWPLETELLRLLIHGMVHLLGYDHELSDAEEARSLTLEIELLGSIGLDGIYGE